MLISHTPTPSAQDAYLLADECLKVRVASIKKEDDNLQKEKDRLDQEKVSPPPCHRVRMREP